ncbi:MAG: NAD(P)/FAD-dependent oxidoreductase [Anaerolinea sp.]|nr:NAD(P)/FAD-dependent oxidoreductase [Anaerolinea sp.]
MVDVIVIGGGPAGVTAALRARELGASAVLIERGRLGGTCTNDGCVPTRVLAKAARLMRDSADFAEYGLIAERPTVDFPALLARTQQVVYQVQEKKQLIDHLEAAQVRTIHGRGGARFVDTTHVAVGDEVIEGSKVIICAGGYSRKLSIPGVEHTVAHSDLWTLKALPASAIIVGGGATGCQVASILSAFGVKVTLIDIAPRILPGEDTLVSSVMRDAFVKSGIDVITGITGIDAIRKDGSTLHVHYIHDERAQQISAELVMLSVGWPGSLEPLNLGAAGVATKGAYIQVDDRLKTTADTVYAAGDITGRMMLVQSASHQARIAVENALLGSDRIDANELIPHGGFTDPEYGSVGMTEEQAAKTHQIAVATIPYGDMDRAMIDGHEVGFCKIIVDRETRELLGAHVVGEQAVEVIQIAAAISAGGMKIEQVADLEFAYPTFAAILGLAARQIARELKVIPLVRQWRELRKLKLAEWERSTEKG